MNARLIATILLIPAFLWFLSWAGALSMPSGWLYDELNRLGSGSEKPESTLLLVDMGADPWLFSATETVDLIQALDSFSPRLIVFVHPPQLDHLPRTVQTKILTPPRSTFSASAADNGDHRVITAELFHPLTEAGICRQGFIRRGSERGLAGTATELLLGKEVYRERDKIYINFTQGTDWIPRVSRDRVMAGGLIPELITGKVVLLGSLSRTPGNSLYTPIHRGETALSYTEYVAYFLETLLAQNDIRHLNTWFTLCVLLVVAALSLIYYQRSSFMAATRNSILLMLLYLLLGWFFLHYLLLWLPVLELLFLQFLLFSIHIRLKQDLAEETLNRVLAGESEWVRSHALPEGFFKTEEHWTQIITLVNQILDLERVIFLERVPGDHRVREVKALGCSINDILERRRDYERTPYSSCIEKKGPLRLDKKYEYLSRQDNNTEETQYLVPLMFAGEVVGFWAFGISAGFLGHPARFESIVQGFANQISKLLYHRQEWLSNKELEKRSLVRFLHPDNEKSLYQRVIEVIAVGNSRRELLDNVLTSMETASIVYDLFGQVLIINRSMEELSKTFSIKVYDISALDFVIGITGMTLSEGRNILNYVTLRKKNVRIPLRLIDGDNSFILMIKPIVAQENKREETGVEAQAFDVSGLLFEIIDIAEYSSLAGMKNSVIDHHITHLKNDLQSVQMANELLANGSDSTQNFLVDSTLEKIRNIRTSIDCLELFMNATTETVSKGGYPIDTLPRLQESIEKYTKKATRSNARIELQAPSVQSLVLSEPTGYKNLLEAIFEILFNDALPESTISITVNEYPGLVVFLFENKGFGLQDEDLQQFLVGDDVRVSSTFLALRELIPLVEDWGGTLKVHSAVNKGFTFELTLIAVM